MSQKNYQIINLEDSNLVNAILDEIESDKIQYVSFDIETNSNVEKTTELLGIGLSYFPNEGVYFTFRKWDSNLNKLIEYLDFFKKRKDKPNYYFLETFRVINLVTKSNLLNA